MFFNPILPLSDAFPPVVPLDWPVPVHLPLVLAVVSAIGVAALAWSFLKKLEAAPRKKREGARVHVLDRVA